MVQTLIATLVTRVPATMSSMGFCRIKQFLSKNGVDFIEQFLLEIA